MSGVVGLPGWGSPGRRAFCGAVRKAAPFMSGRPGKARSNRMAVNGDEGHHFVMPLTNVDNGLTSKKVCSVDLRLVVAAGTSMQKPSTSGSMGEILPRCGRSYSNEKSRYITSPPPSPVEKSKGRDMMGSLVMKFVSTSFPTTTMGIEALRLTPLFSSSFRA